MKHYSSVRHALVKHNKAHMHAWLMLQAPGPDLVCDEINHVLQMHDSSCYMQQLGGQEGLSAGSDATSGTVCHVARLQSNSWQTDTYYRS